MEYQYDVLGVIAAGSFGKVCLVEDKWTGERKAAKKMKNSVPISHVIEEAQLLSLLNIGDVHGFIVKFHGRWVDQWDNDYLVLDLIRHNLEQWMNCFHPHGVNLDTLKVITKRIMGAFKYLESNNIVHGDVKHTNVLMASPSPASLKLCDFGLSRIEMSSNDPAVLPVTGAISFMSPEVLLGYPTRQPRAPDMWGVGCVLTELLNNAPLFNPDRAILDDDDQKEDVVYQHCRMLCKPPPNMLLKARETELCDEIRACESLPEYQGEKPLLRALKKKLLPRYYSKLTILYLYDLLRSFLTMDPDVRTTPSKALMHPFLN